MTSWAGMDNPAVFDPSLWGKRDRKFAEEAAGTLFPDLFPPPSPRPAPKPDRKRMTGDQPLFDLDEVTCDG